MRRKSKRVLWIVLSAVIVMDWVLLYRLNPDTEERTDYYGSKIQEEVKYFPVPHSAADETLSYSYVDSWMSERTYGGDRKHEGCDIMVSENTRGVYPVVSMTDGTLESMGWLKLGGYRLGIRSESGVYYYYAHLESYAENLEEGMSVEAGEFLGFVGDSGYGDEGTTGQFAVHLHVGIYVPDQTGADTAVNPYPILQYLEKSCLYADYGQPGKETEE